MAKDLLLNALQYKQWADARTLDAIAIYNPIGTSKFLSFMLQQLNHIVIVEELFRARLLGLNAPHQSTNTVQIPVLSELSMRLSSSNKWLLAYTQQLNNESLNEMIHFQFVDGRNGRMTCAEILFHLINHGTYHRGAIGHSLDLADGDRPADTYTVFAHAVEPTRRDHNLHISQHT